MAQITWRELTTPPDTGAFRALDAAAGTINNGFDAFNKVIAARQAANQFQQDLGRNANVQAYLDAVQGAKTEADLQALHDSGTLDALRGKVDARDLGLIRGADETRLGSVRKNILDAHKFQDDQTAWDSRDAVNTAFDQVVASKDPAKLSAFMAAIPANHPQRMELASKALALVQGNAKFDSELATNTSTQNRNNAETLAIPKRTDIEAGRLQVEQNRERDTAIARTNEQLTKAAEKLSGYKKQTIGTTEGNAAVLDAVRQAVPDKNQQDSLLRYVGQELAKPENHGMSVADFISAAVGQEDDRTFIGRWANTKSFRGEDLGKSLAALRGQEGYAARLHDQQIQEGIVADQVKNLRGQLKSYMTPAAATAGGAPAAAAPVVAEPPAILTDAQRGGTSAVAAPAAPVTTPPPATTNDVTEAKRVRDTVHSQLTAFIRNPSTPAADRNDAVAQLKSVDVAYEKAFSADAAKRATAEAAALLQANDVRGLHRFQGSPLFDYLDKDTKLKIHQTVNNPKAR